jgi:rhodanese-related sulfurtransferase
VNVPSKTLGELAEAAWHPATVAPETVKRWKSEGKDFRFFDARPPAEYGKMRVPGAVCLPNGELAHRFGAAVPDASTPVVITCAGRTRGLTGAIGLRLAGIMNPVFALENGTQGWALAGESLERGATAEPYPEMDEEARQASRERGRAICNGWGIPAINRDELAAMGIDPSRTTYLFDVRSAEEYRAGHLAGRGACARGPAGARRRPVDRGAPRPCGFSRRHRAQGRAGGILAEAAGV